MDKIIEYYYGENDSELVSLIHPKSFEKTAQMSDELSTFISNLEHKEGVTYVLANAVSSGEKWGPNLNGDYFPEEALKKYHQTFVEHGNVFSHHVNKDPKLSMGKIIFSHYNPAMHRVELILELDNKKVKDVVENLQKGILKKISMGCFIPGTKVVIDNFTKKNIEDIKENDLVLTHKGSLKKVTELHERDYKGKVYTITPVGKFRNSVTATKEHPWLIVESNSTIEDAIWKTSEQLSEDDYLVIPKPKVDEEIHISNEKAMLLGGNLQLHSEIFRWNKEAKLSFLGACVDLSFVNKNLLEQIQWLGFSLGLMSTIEHKATEWILRFNKSECLVKIDSINEEFYKGPVYNLEVEEDNSYVVEQYAVHNCKVPQDFCSICGHSSKNIQEYCTHLKTQMGQILPGGKKVYAINWQPKFFDLSIVTVPADKTASFLKMLTADKKNNNLLKQKLASFEENNYIKLAELKNTAEIKKTVIGTITAVDTDPKKLLVKKLKNETIEKLSAYSFNSVLSTFLGLRIFPTKEDFQKLALKKELPDNAIFEIDEHTEPIIPSDVSYDYFDPKIASILESEIPQLSLTKELVVTRALNELTGKKEEWNPTQPPSERSFLSRLFFGKEEEPKISPQKNPIVPLGILGGLYYGYAKIFNDASSTGFRNFMVKNPWLIPLLIGGATIGTLELQDKLFTKQAASVDRFFRNSLISFPIAYYVSGKAEHEAQQGKQITSTQNFIRKHPALVALLTAGLGASAENKLDRLLKIGSVVSRLPEEILNSMYSDLINSKEE